MKIFQNLYKDYLGSSLGRMAKAENSGFFGKFLLAAFFVLVMIFPAQAQNADQYFHGGAQSFIGANLQDAIAQVQEGLARYPNDPKLNALLQKLEEEQEKQKQQQNQEKQQQQQNQDQQQQEQEQNQEKQEQEQQQNEGENANEQEPKPQEGEATEPREISKEDAEKILQALAQKEKELLKEFKKQKTQGSAGHEKDW